MRPIDADVLLKNLADFRCDAPPLTWANGWGEAAEAIIAVVERAPTITPTPRWIPAEERLPEEDGWMLIYLDNRPGSEWDVMYWYGGGWAACRETAKSITHWMPLQVPPKEATP